MFDRSKLKNIDKFKVKAFLSGVKEVNGFPVVLNKDELALVAVLTKEGRKLSPKRRNTTTAKNRKESKRLQGKNYKSDQKLNLTHSSEARFTYKKSNATIERETLSGKGVSKQKSRLYAMDDYKHEHECTWKGRLKQQVMEGSNDVNNKYIRSEDTYSASVSHIEKTMYGRGREMLKRELAEQGIKPVTKIEDKPSKIESWEELSKSKWFDKGNSGRTYTPSTESDKRFNGKTFVAVERKP